MAQLSNGPQQQVVLRLKARKSFALGLWIQDHNRNPLDITGSTIRMVVRKTVSSTVVDDSGNLITNSVAIPITPLLGYAKIELQAADLDFPAGEYTFTIVLSDGGYSSVIAEGPLVLEQNTEFESVGETYPPGEEIATALEIAMRQGTTLSIRTGSTLAPGQATFTSELEDKLLAMYAGALAAGETLTADDIPDGSSKVMMTVEEREALEDLSLEWDDITGKPAFGTAALKNEEDFLEPLGVSGADITSGEVDADRLPIVTGLRGIVVTTDAPPGGSPGTIYLKYTP